jgi:plastocyanin
MPGTRRLALVAGLVTMVAVAGLAVRGDAGPDRIAFPAAFKNGVLYTVTDRHDIKQYRELYASPAAIAAAKRGDPLPHGTVLTLVQYKAKVDAQGNPIRDANGRFVKGDLIAYAVMEKRRGWGHEYPEDIRNGEWEYAVFTADGALNDKVNYTACFQCHKPHDEQDYVMSYLAMAGKTRATSTAAVPAGNIPVTIQAFAFGPGGVTIAPGKSITWVNADDSPHQVTVQGTRLRTDFILKGASATLTFDKEGVYSYNCALHPGMKGSVEVRR